MKDAPLAVSVVIPSRNEGDDVRLAIESALAQRIAPIEVLVVDDSSDGTPAVIREYASRGVRFVPGPGRGCCEARNLGMREAQGDIAVLLNADVVLPPDFTERILAHYRSGADYVLVESRVLNLGDMFARFVEAQHRVSYGHRDDLQWTEGFSARRSALEAVGYIPGDFPVRFCRDWFLGRALAERGFRRVLDRAIVVAHKAPAAFGEYWRVRAARGRFAILAQHYLLGRSRAFLGTKLVLKHAFRLAIGLLLIPPLAVAARLSRHGRGVRDILPFFFAYVIQELARAAGEWQGFFAIQ